MKKSKFINMTTLEKIVKKAQALKKSYPKKFAKWTDYVKEASKEFRSTTTSAKKKSKLGAIPVGFQATFRGNPFYLTNQYDIFNNISLEVTDKKTNEVFAVIDKNSKTDLITDQFIIWLNSKGVNTDSERDLKSLHKEIKPLAVNLLQEVKAFNKGKKKAPIKTTIKKKAPKKEVMKKKPIVRNTAKKLSDLIRTEIKSKKYIMPHGYEVRRSKLGAVMSISDNAKQLLIDCIDLDGYDMKANTPIEKIRAVEKIFYSEYGYMINRVGKLKALEEWLRGLPSVITIPFYNVEIIEIAKKWGSLKMNATEKQEDKILINYWRYMANQLLQLFNKKKLSDKFN